MPRRRAVALLALAALTIAGCGAQARAHTVDGGRLLYRSFASKALGGTEHYAIFLPSGYGSGGRRYPVVYALHGLPAGPDAYRRMGIDVWGRAAERAGHAAIIVSPQGARPGDSDPEWHDWGSGRDWESAVARDLVREVDRRYRTIADRRGRALIGVSAGGYGAAIIGFHHPETFSVIQAWSGYFHPTNPEGTAPLDLGSPEENAAASVHTYVPLIRRMYRRWHPSSFGFYVGDSDSRFLAENKELHKELLAAHVPHTFAVYPGGHSGSFWAAHEDAWIGDAVAALGG